jgi:DNA invertase Pin-like site-specific DNA recombinase
MARPRKRIADQSVVVAYVRVSTQEQADSGLGIEAQITAIKADIQRRGWKLLKVCTDEGLSGKSLDRPGVTEALDLVTTGRAGTLMVSKLDRLSRSLVDFAGLMAQATSQKWNLVALDLGIDLSTPAGEFMANVMASAAQWERRIIGQRTKDALAAKRAQGVRLGRPNVLDPEIAAEIVAAHDAGAGWSQIARVLNDRGVPTAHGGSKWYPSTVRAVVLGKEAA